MSIKVNILENNSENFQSKLEKGKFIKQTMADIAKQLFNETHNISIIYGDHKNGKENYKILKQLLGIDKLKGENISIEEKFLDKEIDKNHIVEAFLIKLSGENKEIYKNITAIFKKKGNKKVLKHVHISEPKMLDGGKVKKLDRKYFKHNKINDSNLEEKGIGKNKINNSTLIKKLKIDPENPEDIAKSIMINFWGKALLLGADEVVKLFSPNALLKGTVVQHLSVGDEGGIKDYFKHFCEKRPRLKISHIEANWLEKGESILAKGEYIFTLSEKNGETKEVPANFTMVFVNRNGKWMIDLLHSSLKYNKEELEKLNN